MAMTRKHTNFLERVLIYLAMFAILIELTSRSRDTTPRVKTAPYPVTPDVGSYFYQTMQLVLASPSSSSSFSFGLPLAAAAPIEEYSVDPEGTAAGLPSAEPFSDRLTRLDVKKFHRADHEFPGYLTPAARMDAAPGNCQVWSSLLVIVKNEDFLRFINSFDKPSPKHSGFIYFLGHIGGARHHKLDPKFNFDRLVKGGISLQTRQGKTLTASTAKELGEQMLAEIAIAEKMILLGTVPDIKTYLEALPSGMYVIELQFLGTSALGHQVTLSISASREYVIFDTMQKGLFLSFDDYLRWLNEIKSRLNDILISLTSYSPRLLEHPIDIKRLPNNMDLLSAFYSSDYRSCTEIVVGNPALRSNPYQLFITAILYRESLEDVKFLHEELAIGLNVKEGFKTAPKLTVAARLPTMPEETFVATVPIQYALIALFQTPETMPIFDYLLEGDKVNINMTFVSSTGITHTPLSMAIRANLSEAAKKLIAKGADLSRKNGVDLIERCLEMLNYEVLKVLIHAGIDLKQPINSNFYNPKAPERMIPPIEFFTATAKELEVSNPIVAKEFQALADLAHQMKRKSTKHPRAETPLRGVMDATTEKEKPRSSSLAYK